jgi:hypothetical protein
MFTPARKVVREGAHALRRVQLTCGCIGAIVVVLALTACGSSGGSTPGTGTADQSSSGAAVILSFTVPKSVQCGSRPTTPVPISYAVDAARSQKILVDSHVQPATEATRGTITAPVPCDGRRHSVALLVTGMRGHLIGRVEYVTTVPGRA